ncbi:MAG: hypothetical protein C5B59_07700 [Bacteroidetes bacterium]|nr:MAG: hypothetical protein C5B59_07700 [Bacteroidota bacterium]
MDNKNFFIRLIPPRPSFSVDMNEEERKIMQEHVNYWRELLDKDFAIVYGPVFDPAGGYGIGIVQAPMEENVREIMDRDPTKSGLNFTFEIFEMRAVRKI